MLVGLLELWNLVDLSLGDGLDYRLVLWMLIARQEWQCNHCLTSTAIATGSATDERAIAIARWVRGSAIASDPYRNQPLRASHGVSADKRIVTDHYQLIAR